MPAKIQDLDSVWDAIVIGAGPAGSFASYLLAKQGCKVLLVDKANFPRHKVCGCCLNALALQILSSYGLGSMLDNLSAVHLKQFSLHTSKNSVQFSLPNSRAISREAFDSELIRGALGVGVSFAPQTQATIDQMDVSGCRVITKDAQGEQALVGRVVIVADGITGGALDKHNDFAARVHKKSRMGAGTVLSEGNSFYRPGVIYMSSGSGGYLGLVRLEDNRLDIAAAFDHEFVRSSSGPASAAQKLLSQAGLPAIPELSSAKWQGTVALSRARKKIAGRRVFVIGDASSYGEPLTGEGMAWALLSAALVAPIAQKAIVNWSDNFARTWSQEHSRLIKPRQLQSSRIAGIMRNSALTMISVELLKVMPFIADAFIQSTIYANIIPKINANQHLNEPLEVC